MKIDRNYGSGRYFIDAIEGSCTISIACNGYNRVDPADDLVENVARAAMEKFPDAGKILVEIDDRIHTANHDPNSIVELSCKDVESGMRETIKIRGYYFPNPGSPY